MAAEQAERRAKAKRARPTRLRSQNTADWWRLWREAVEVNFPGTEVPSPWSVAQRAILKQKARKWESERHTIGEFIEWCAANWLQATAAGWPRSHRKGATFVPDRFPNLRFLLGQWDTFVAVFERGLSDEKVRLQGPSERFYREALRRGLSEEKARLEAFRRAAELEARNQVEDARARHAERMLSLAEREKLEAQRLAERAEAAAARAGPKPTLAEQRRKRWGDIYAIPMTAPEDW